MSKKRVWFILVFLLLFGGLVVFSRAAAAQSGYPPYSDVYINDFANVINPQHENLIRTELTNLFQEQGTEVTVVTIRSIRDYNVGANTIEAFATGLFNTWGVGNAERNDGVMLLVAVEDRELRIEVGVGYESTKNAIMQNIIDNVVVPRFRNGDMSGGIYEGTQAIVENLSARAVSSAPRPTQVANTSNPAPVNAGETNSAPVTSSGRSSGTVAAVGGAAGLAALGTIFGVARYRRYRPRDCSQCGTPMVRLDEQLDDDYLDEGQQTEERLGSVDYDIWHCPQCEHHEAHRFGTFFTRFQKCSQCGYRTMSTSSSVITQPTYHSTGTQQIRQTCRHCSYNHTYTRTIPKRVQSTSSSSGSSRSSSSRSFGGGRSSGGGASGRW